MTDPKNWGGRCDSTDAPQILQTKQKKPKSTAITTAEQLAVTIAGNEPRVDSRLLAGQLRNQHQAVIKLIDRYPDALQRFGKVVFQKAPSTDSRTGQRERYAMLTEDQAFFLLSLSRNTDHVVDLKAKLIVAFRDARRAVELRGTEGLSTYHDLHDMVAVKAAGSAHAGHVHGNVNKLINRFAGIDPGQRRNAGLPQQALVIVAQTVAARVLRSATDHHDGYANVKQALQALSTVAALEVSP